MLNSKCGIYGPVPSRRLGFSLGIDIIPYKTCSFDCTYCQLGKTTNKTIEIKEWESSNGSAKELLKAVNHILSTKSSRIDYITFGGSGEPTLNSKLGSLIKVVKQMTSIPVAVLTNGSLLYQAKVRENLMPADLVVPSFSAATPALLEKVNRPHPSITLDLMIEGLNAFCKEFKGSIWLEIMLIKGINDAPEHIRKLKSMLRHLSVSKIHLNTVVRPPTEKSARPLNETELKAISKMINLANVEIIAEFLPQEDNYSAADKTIHTIDMKQKIYEIVKRRAVTVKDITSSLSISQAEVKKELANLEKEGKIKKEKQKDTFFYVLTE